jgi:hypothetical protein
MRFFAAALSALLLQGCGDYSEDLGDGYRFVQTNSSNHVVIRMKGEYVNEIIVHSDIKKHVYNDDYVLGYRIQSGDPEAQYNEALSQKNGYFILNKNNGQLTTGLQVGELKNLTEKIGMHELAQELTDQ